MFLIYRDDFKKVMIENVKAAIKDDKLDGGSVYKAAYKGDDVGPIHLEKYAEYVLNEVIYRIALDVMSKKDTWVTQTINA